jgi:hypothetical protein
MFNDAVEILRGKLKLDRSVGNTERIFKITDVNVLNSYISKEDIYVHSWIPFILSPLKYSAPKRMS